MNKVLFIALFFSVFLNSSCIKQKTEQSFKVGDCIKPTDNDALWIVRELNRGKPFKGEQIFKGKVFAGPIEMNKHILWVNVPCPEGVN